MSRPLRELNQSRHAASSSLLGGVRATAWVALVLLATALVTSVAAQESRQSFRGADAEERAAAEAREQAQEFAEVVAAARQRWSKLGPEERRQVRQRFAEWQGLDPDVRAQVRHNYQRLLTSQRLANGPDGEIRREMIQRVERYTTDPVHRLKLRTLHAEIGPHLREDRVLLREVHRLEPTQRRIVLREARRAHRLAQLDEMLDQIGADDQQALRVHEIIEAHAAAEAQVLETLRAERLALYRDNSEKLTELLGDDLTPEARRHLRRWIAPPHPQRYR